VLELAPAAKLTMGRRDRDESLPQYERDSLEQMIRPITAVMRVIDASPDTPDQAPPPPQPKKRKPGALKDLLEAGLLKTGAKIRPVSSNYDASSTVAADGRLALGGQMFNTPSGAAVAVVGRPENGWTFWAVPSGDGSLVPLDELRRRLGLEKPEEQAESEPSTAATEKPVSGTEAKPGSLIELIEAGLLSPGARLVATYKGSQYETSIAEDGRLLLSDGSLESSLSRAAVRVTGRPTNGWTFWKLKKENQTISLARLREGHRQRNES